MALAMAAMLCLAILVFFSYLKRFTVNKVKIESKDVAVMMLIAFGIVFVVKVYLFIVLPISWISVDILNIE